MRLRLLTLFAAGLLVACEPAKPASSVADVPPEALPNMAGVAERGPEMDFKPMAPQTPEAEQARQQADASFRELDRSAAAIGPDIAGMRNQAHDAYRRGLPPEPALPPRAPASPRTPAEPVPPAPAPATPAPVPGG